ncbi:hypothetical protein scyTo_0014255 [Scyliorhinus torazame]|uniref:Ig-like domain-containing protein n=1 Tax=Scyliorhinus torazame TaxID=75743 RepID=A0A401NJ94_SCYTO|nr:hypothetical protein [Scyliorhinus torazame]
MSRDSFLFFLLLCPGTGSSESDPWRVLVACFVTDNPSLQPLMCEVTVDDRMFIYYDSTLPSVQVLDSGLEEYRWILAKLVSDRERTIASLRREMAFIATISNSSPPNDFGELFLYPESEVTYGEMNVLTCLVNGAFPPTITVTLQMNGVPIDAGVNSSRLSFGEDWRFRVTRHAQIRPAAGDLYSCEVLHTISNEVKVVYWGRVFHKIIEILFNEWFVGQKRAVRSGDRCTPHGQQSHIPQLLW